MTSHPEVDRRIRVTPTIATRQEDDAPVVVDPEEAELVLGDPGEDRVGRVVLATGSTRDRKAVLFGLGRAVTGSSDGAGGMDLNMEVVVDGWRFAFTAEPEWRAALRERAGRGAERAGHGGSNEVRAIFPGRVVAVSVAAGDAIEAGQQVLVIEAMKMQNELRAPRGGVVERIAVGDGAKVEVGDLLLVIR
jgi:biotin carboxyl carrier protein